MMFVLGLSIIIGASLPVIHRWVGQLLHLTLHWMLKDPRVLWRVGDKQWQEELAQGLLFQHRCPNCAWWDATLASDQASRLHGAMDHVYYTGGGLRMGQEVPDRWCSCTTSAAVAIWRHEAGKVLHCIQVERGDAMDLRWLCDETPHIHSQCRTCRLPDDAASYCLKWGIWLQEVLVDRCSIRHQVRTVRLLETSIPEWAQTLSSEVVYQSYRRDRVEGQAQWVDVWALIQEYRLRRVLRSLF